MVARPVTFDLKAGVDKASALSKNILCLYVGALSERLLLQRADKALHRNDVDVSKSFLVAYRRIRARLANNASPLMSVIIPVETPNLDKLALSVRLLSASVVESVEVNVYFIFGEAAAT